jgi:hypothetical protein
LSKLFQKRKDWVIQEDRIELKDIVKWIGIAILAAIPAVILIKRLAKEIESEVDSSDIFAEELGM